MIFPSNNNYKLNNNSITTPVYILRNDLFHNGSALHQESRLELKGILLRKKTYTS